MGHHMKLLRYGPVGKEKPGLLDSEGKIRDLSKIVSDIGGDVLSPKSLAKLRKLKPESLPLVKGKPRIGACVANPQKFIAIGLNYSDHAAESGLAVPPDTLEHLRQLAWLTVNSTDFVNYKIGMRVKVVFHDVTDEITLPKFAPAE